MSKMIQIRNVPDDLHAELKVRAARAGMTLSDFLLHEVERVANRMSPDELLERIRARERPDLSVSPAEAIRAQRGDPHDVGDRDLSSAEAIREQRDRG